MLLTSSCWISGGVFALGSFSSCCSDSVIFRKPLMLLWASSRDLRTHPTAAPCPDSRLSLGSLQLFLTSAPSCHVVQAFQLRSICICLPSTDLLVTLLEVLVMTSSQSPKMVSSMYWKWRICCYKGFLAGQSRQTRSWIHSRPSISSNISASKWIHIIFAFVDRQEKSFLGLSVFCRVGTTY